jgi:hypothetical protein
MRGWWWLVLGLAACSFDVRGVPPGDPSSPAASPPADNSATDSPPTGSPPASSPPAPTTPGTGQLNPPPATPPIIPPPDGGLITPISDVGHTCPCSPGEICENGFGAPLGGYCTLDCSTATCPDGSICIQVSGQHLCAQSCPAAGCRKDVVCCTKNYPMPGVCVPSSLCD